MPPLSPLVAVITAASASASFTATPAAMSLRGRACIHTNTPSEALVKLERQIQRRGAVLDHAHGNRAAADGNRPRQTRVQMASSDQWMEKGAARERRISYLKNKGDLNASESGELDGLISRGLQFEEQYNTRTFSAEHVAFKASHNAALAALAAHCSGEQRGHDGRDDGGSHGCNLFYLDGPDAGTTHALFGRGIQPSRCYVANRHASSCEALVLAGVPRTNVAHEWAEEALRRPVPEQRRAPDDAGGPFGGVDFGCFYFDGCSGHPPIVVEMAAAALGARRGGRPRAPVALGYTLCGGGRDIVERELFVTRAVVRLAKAAGSAAPAPSPSPSPWL